MKRLGQRYERSAQSLRAVLLSFFFCMPLFAQTQEVAPLPPLPVIHLSAGLYRLTAEVAMSDAARTRGLMYRRQLGAMHGMLFTFSYGEPTCMWMRNTFLPLSVAFLDRQGYIINIEEMAAQSDDIHCAKTSASYALEMNAGWFAQHGLRAGARIFGLEQIGAK